MYAENFPCVLFQFWTCVASMRVFLHVCAKMAIWPGCVAYVWKILTYMAICWDCHQCGFICTTDDVAQEAKLVFCADFSKLQKFSFECIITEGYTRCRSIVSLHNSKIGSRVDITSLLGRGVTPSGNLKIDPISDDHPPASCCFHRTNYFWIRNDIIHPAANHSHVIWAPLWPN